MYEADRPTSGALPAGSAGAFGGKKLFQGGGVVSRWDGRYKGEAVPEDVYVWVWFAARNAPVEYKGTITVIR